MRLVITASKISRTQRVVQPRIKSTFLWAGCGNPSLSLHGIEGAFSGVWGAKTVVPAKFQHLVSLFLYLSFVEHTLNPTLVGTTPKHQRTSSPLVISYIESEFAQAEQVRTR